MATESWTLTRYQCRTAPPQFGRAYFWCRRRLRNHTRVRGASAVVAVCDVRSARGVRLGSNPASDFHRFTRSVCVCVFCACVGLLLIPMFGGNRQCIFVYIVYTAPDVQPTAWMYTRCYITHACTSTVCMYTRVDNRHKHALASATTYGHTSHRHRTMSIHIPCTASFSLSASAQHVYGVPSTSPSVFSGKRPKPTT